MRGAFLRIGFVERVRGSHHIFTCDGVDEILNLQREDPLPNRIRSSKFATCSFDIDWLT